MTENIDPDGGFEVRLQRSSRTIAVPPGETILDILLDNGVNVSFSCSDGVCGNVSDTARTMKVLGSVTPLGLMPCSL